MTENEKLIIKTIREDRKAYRDTVLPLKLSHIAMNNIIAKEAWEEECSRLQAENAALRERLGKAVELPCKIGDTVYYLQTYCDYKGETVKHCSKKERPIMCECDEIAKRWSLPNWIYVIRERQFRLSDLSRIGKTVFLYCEEAEAKIAELKERRK